MSTDLASSQALGSTWWLVLIEGVAALIPGLLLLLAPGRSLVALVGVVGLYFDPLSAASIVPVVLGILGIGVGVVGMAWAFRLK